MWHRFANTIVKSFVLSGLVCMAWAQSTVSSSKQPFYRNHAYGYVLKLPPGVRYTKTVPPNPDHGVGISLEQNVELWVDASYTDSSSTEEEANLQTGGCKLVQQRQAKLGRQDALEVRFSCP